MADYSRYIQAAENSKQSVFALFVIFVDLIAICKIEESKQEFFACHTTHWHRLWHFLLSYALSTKKNKK